jgi:hypothetical protein
VITTAPLGNGGTAPPPLPFFIDTSNSEKKYSCSPVNPFAGDAFLKLKNLNNHRR